MIAFKTTRIYGNKPLADATAAVEYALDRAAHQTDGCVESHRARTDRLAKLVGKLIEVLDLDEDQLNTIFDYDVEVTKGD